VAPISSYDSLIASSWGLHAFFCCLNTALFSRGLSHRDWLARDTFWIYRYYSICIYKGLLV